MIQKWKVFYWLNLCVVLVNWSAITYRAISLDSWFIMPCIIILVMSCFPPAIFSLVIWRTLKRKEVGLVYLNELFGRKIQFSLPVLLVLLAWFWWGGAFSTILFGTLMASWVSAILFWSVGSKDLVAVIPEIKCDVRRYYKTVPVDLSAGDLCAKNIMGSSWGVNTELQYRSESFPHLNSNTHNFSSSTLNTHDSSGFPSSSPAFNPASGMPMVNDNFDIHGDVYGTSSSNQDYYS